MKINENPEYDFGGHIDDPKKKTLVDVNNFNIMLSDDKLPSFDDKVLEYKKLVRIRILLDENPAKAKQLLTDIINKFELEHYKMGEIPK
jgi:hypothetical protein